MNKQQIYEKYMNIASFEIKDMNVFDISLLSEYMISNYSEMKKEQGEEPLYSYYRMRTPGLSLNTGISETTYPNLSHIFMEKIKDIIESDEDQDNSEFVEICKLESSKCNQDEKKISRHNYDDYQPDGKHTIIDKRMHYITKEPPSDIERCNLCFKFVPQVDGFKLTDGFIDKKFPGRLWAIREMEKNKLVKRNTSPLINEFFDDVKNWMENIIFQIYITLATGEKIEASSLYFINRIEENKPVYEFFGFFEYDYLSLMHTMDSTKILEEVKRAWKNLSNVKSCFYIHWLFTNACPFQRGFAKVLLNAALLRIGESVVKETPDYHAKTDWVAMLSTTFEKYYKDVDKMFTNFDYKFKTKKSKKKVKKVKKGKI